jgi:hypothetical protein
MGISIPLPPAIATIVVGVCLLVTFAIPRVYLHFEGWVEKRTGHTHTVYTYSTLGASFSSTSARIS